MKRPLPCYSILLLPAILSSFHPHSHTESLSSVRITHTSRTQVCSTRCHYAKGYNDGNSTMNSDHDHAPSLISTHRVPNKTKYRITPSIVEAVKSMADIVEVVESYKLPRFSKTGPDRATALCPFHDDHNPSLSIDGTRRMFQCFSCGAAGDVFQFVREYARVVDGSNLNGEEMSFPAAVEFVATEFLPLDSQMQLDFKPLSNKSIHPETLQKQKVVEEKKNRLKLANSAAAEYFCSCLMRLPSAGHARSHLRERGVSPMAVREYVLGYAPDVYFGREASRGTNEDSEKSMVDHLKNLGFTPDEIVEAGLATRKNSSNSKSSRKVKKRQKKFEEPPNVLSKDVSSECYNELIDRFRNRLMVPIFDESGKHVIGFGGRLLESPNDNESNERYKHAKYINSPETPIFSKKKTLFGISSFRNNLRDKSKIKKIMLVEGYFDALSLREIGFDVAATMGTAITFDQLEAASKAVGRGGQIIMCMDSDDAGITAVERLCASSLLLKLNDQYSVNVFIATLPSDVKDPSEYIQSKGGTENKNVPEAFNADILTNLTPWCDWFISQTIHRYDVMSVGNDKNSFADVCNKLSNFLATFPIPTERTRLAYLSAGKLAEMLADQSGTSSAALRIQLESDLLEMASRKANTRIELSRRTESPNELSKLTDGGITYIESKEQAKLIAEATKSKRNMIQTIKNISNDNSRFYAANHRNAPSSYYGNNMKNQEFSSKLQKSYRTRAIAGTKKVRNETPYMPHFNGFDFFHETDRQWLGLDNDFNGRKKNKFLLGEIDKESPKKFPVYFNSNAYLGSYEKKPIDSLPDEDAYATLRMSEKKLLRILVRFAHSRASMSTSLRLSTATLQWTSPERSWLFKCLVEESNIMYEGDRLKEYLLSRRDVPLKAFGKSIRNNVLGLKDESNIDIDNSEKPENSFDNKVSIPDDYDPSDFGNTFLETDQISLAELEVIYESDNDDEISIVATKPTDTKNSRQSESNEDVLIDAGIEQDQDESGALDDIFIVDDPEEIEIESLEGKGSRAELMIQETFACMLRSIAFIRRDQTFQEYRKFSEFGSNINNRVEVKRLYTIYKEALDESVELDLSYKRISSRLIDHTFGGGMKNAKVEFEEKFFAEMDEFYDSLPDDLTIDADGEPGIQYGSDDNNYNDIESKVTLNDANDREEVNDEEDFDVDDFLYGWSDIIEQ